MTEDHELYRLAVEHAMRLTDDEAGAWLFATSPRCSQEMMVALGRLLASASSPLAPGSPIVVWAGGGHAVDPGWRSVVAGNTSSLWARLEFLLTICGPVSGPDAEHDLALLLMLEEAAAAGVSG